MVGNPFEWPLKRRLCQRHRRTFLSWLSAWLLFVIGPSIAQAQTAAAAKAHADIARIDPLVRSGELFLDMDISLMLNATMKQALMRGVPLYFALELQIEQPRWWWLNKTLVDTTLVRRISLDTLTRTWRISTGNLAITAGTYEEALSQITHVRQWPIVPSDRFEPNTTYEGRVRIRLDTEQLARPLQMDAAGRNQWALSSDWKAFEFSVQRSDGKTP